jgi:branched-chain amino acid transport system substrate-binding protein
MAQVLVFLVGAWAAQALAQSPALTQNPPVWIGFDDAYGVKTNTSAIVS